MAKIILYHGTSAEKARIIEKEGFVPDKNYNWKVVSKKGYVYLSIAYAPFYAMANGKTELAIIKVEVEEKDLFPDDDFVMITLKKPSYTQEELDKINLRRYKSYWRASLKHLGNVAVRPKDIKIIGIRIFNGERLLFKCDPVICPDNFMIMGDYYRKLTEWIFNGKDFLEFPNFMSG